MKSICSLSIKNIRQNLQMKESPINMWREKIKTCKFDCWDCNYCEAVVDSHMKKADLHVHPHVETCIDAFENSGKYLSNHTSTPVPGLTSSRVDTSSIIFAHRRVLYI